MAAPTPGGCPMGYGNGAAGVADPAFVAQSAAIHKAMLSCAFTAKKLNECRLRVSTEGQGACAQEVRLHRYCQQAQKENYEATNAACSSDPKGEGKGGLPQVEMRYRACVKDSSLGGYFNAALGHRCIAEMEQFKACARRFNGAS